MMFIPHGEAFLVTDGKETAVVYGWYEHWPSQCYWIVPGTHDN
jgi:CTP synthase (UTP-ammonia lyase)